MSSRLRRLRTSCLECFDAANTVETEIRNLADDLYANCDWEWARNGGTGIPYQWHPEHGHDPINWSGYDEGMFISARTVSTTSKTLGAPRLLSKPMRLRIHSDGTATTASTCGGSLRAMDRQT